MVTQSARSSGIDFAPSLGKLVSGLIIFVVSMMAVAQLKIDTDIVRIVTSFILGGAALAFGISFGLGTRDIIRNITAGFYTRKFLRIGRQGGDFGPARYIDRDKCDTYILRSEDHEISVSNATFLNTVAQSRLDLE